MPLLPYLLFGNVYLNSPSNPYLLLRDMYLNSLSNPYLRRGVGMYKYAQWLNKIIAHISYLFKNNGREKLKESENQEHNFSFITYI